MITLVISEANTGFMGPPEAYDGLVIIFKKHNQTKVYYFESMNINLFPTMP